MNLTKKTAEWAAHRFITDSQRQAILTYEKQQNKTTLILLWLGVFCVGLGIISMIAAHWDVLPDAVKLAGAFGLLGAALATGVYGITTNRPQLKETGLFLSFLLIGGVIGLVAQIYHLDPDSKNGALLWAGCALPVVLFSGYRLLPVLWFFPALWSVPNLTLTDSVFHAILIGMIGVPVSVLCERGKLPIIRAAGLWALVLTYLNFISADMQSKVLPGSLGTLSFLAVMAVIAAYRNKTKLFKMNIFLIGSRILVLYFQVFVDMMTTGLLIAGAGGAVILMTVFGKRMQRRVLKSNLYFSISTFVRNTLKFNKKKK